MPDPTLEEFVGRLRQALAGLPRQARDEELDEVRAHLYALVDEYRSRGLDQAAAVAAAIDRFGSADGVGRGLVTVRRRHQLSGYLALLLFMVVGGVPAALATGALLDAEPFRWAQALPRALDLAITMTLMCVVVDLWRRRRRARDLHTAVDAYLHRVTTDWGFDDPDAPGKQHARG